MKILFIITLLMFSGMIHANDAEKLAIDHGCFNCHRVNAKMVGPSFMSIAAANIKKEGAREILSGKILKGSTGSWGLIPMAANYNIPVSDAEILARWILTIK